MAFRLSNGLHTYSIAAAIAWLALGALPAQAGISVGDSIRFTNREGNTGGGEFGVAELPNANTELFRTFCLQVNEYLDFSPLGFKVVDISDRAQGYADDPLDARTAYLYTQFSKGTLSGYDYSPNTSGHAASADALQRAFWAIENETGPASGQALAWINEAALAISSGAWSGLGNVRVLSIAWIDRHDEGREPGTPGQDVLMMVPEPASFMVWSLLGVAGLVAYRRRLRK